MGNKNNGVYLERKLSESLAAWCRENKGFFYRFYDAKAARNLFPNQPGDFFWLIPGQAILLECKSTQTGENLIDLLEQKQVAKHRLWLRAGHSTLFLYYNHLQDTFAFYWGEQVVTAFYGGRLQLEPAASGTLRVNNTLPTTLPTLADIVRAGIARACTA